MDPAGWTKNGADQWVPAPAMVYVALSRAASIANVRLVKRLALKSIVATEKVRLYYRRVFGH